ncbi:MAG TPA: RNA-binding protein [Blastocatellia bacterium]|jgi:RNA recognition motif-containing protein|nr:RNA-binding protein [Blastocatellia bacterium]
MAIRLFVGNLPYNATEADLREHFAPVGALSYAYIPMDKETGKPRGFAFIEFSDRAQADEAIRRFNNQPFKGRNLAINEARAKEDRPPSGAPRTGFAPRPAPIPSFDRDASAPRGEAPSRNFGPDAAPRRARKKPGGAAKSERGPKGPIRERTSGQIFGGDDDQDDFQDQDDLINEDDDNFASREDYLDSEDDKQL